MFVRPFERVTQSGIFCLPSRPHTNSSSSPFHSIVHHLRNFILFYFLKKYFFTSLDEILLFLFALCIKIIDCCCCGTCNISLYISLSHSLSQDLYIMGGINGGLYYYYSIVFTITLYVYTGTSDREREREKKSISTRSSYPSLPLLGFEREYYSLSLSLILSLTHSLIHSIFNNPFDMSIDFDCRCRFSKKYFINYNRWEFVIIEIYYVQFFYLLKRENLFVIKKVKGITWGGSR
jgi:hypothetical protein